MFSIDLRSLMQTPWWGLALAPFILSCILATAYVTWLYIYYTFSAPKGIPIPLAGEATGKRTFGFRTRFSYYFDCDTLFQDTYNRYSKHGQPVYVPGMGPRDQVVLPLSYLSWAITLSETVLSPESAYVELNSIASVLGDDRHMTDTWPGHLVKSDLTKNLDFILPVTKEELEVAIDAKFGKDTSKWTEVPLDALRSVIAQAASRYTVGFPLYVLHITDGMPRNAVLVGTAPSALKPVMGFLGSFDTRLRLAAFIKKFEPLFHQRLEILQKDKTDFQEPQDFFQMMMRFAQTKRPQELNLRSMAERLCIANFSSVHQTSFAATNMLLDLISSDQEFDTISSLRTELEDVFGPLPIAGYPSALWTKSNIQSMHKADSIMRESLRLHTFPQRFMPRRVQIDDLYTPDGHHLPKGTIITFFSGPVQKDPDNYTNPLKYDPWRFSSQRKEGDGADGLSFASLSSAFYAFGRGRHACSGRGLVDYELKMVIAYLVSNYDMKLPDKCHGRRPPNTWATEVQYPPEGQTIMVKRRIS